MRFTTDAVPGELPAFLMRFISLVGADKLRARIKKLEIIESNPAAAHYFRDRYGLELALTEIIKYKKATGRILWPPKTVSHYRLYSFMAMVVRTYNRLSLTGKKRLVGELRKSLDQEHGFAPLAFEMNMAGHLMTSGFDVEYCDLEGKEKFDFLVSKDADIIEVECKFVSDDIGRKIHKRKFYDLAEKIKPLLDRFSNSIKGGVFIHVKVRDRLNREDFERIEKNIERALEYNELKEDELTMHNFDLSDVPFSGNAWNNQFLITLEKFFRDRFDIANPYLMINGIPNKALISVCVTSNKPDEVLDGIYRKHLRAASEQLSGNRIGAAFLYFCGLDEDALHTVAKVESGLISVVRTILAKRDKMYGVALMVGGKVTISQSNLIIAPILTKESGYVYTFQNPYFSLPIPAENIFQKIFRGNG